MTDLTNNQRVANEIKNLTEAFKKQATSLETAEQTAAAFLEYILERERIRRDVTAPGPNQDAVDAETLVKLQNCQLDDPKLVEAEAVLRRFGNNPADGISYFMRLVSNRQEELSEINSAAGRQPRPRGRKPFANIIDDFVDKNPNISQSELLHKMKNHEDIRVVEDRICCLDPHDEMKVDALRGALSRSKKRLKKRLKKSR